MIISPPPFAVLGQLLLATVEQRARPAWNIGIVSLEHLYFVLERVEGSTQTKDWKGWLCDVV